MDNIKSLLFLQFFRRSFDIAQPDFAAETTAPFYYYRSQLQKGPVTSSQSPKPDLDKRVSVISLIPPDEVTASVGHAKVKHHSSSLDVIREEQYTSNGTAGTMVELDGGFSVLAVPSDQSGAYTSEDYTTISKVKRTAPPALVQLAPSRIEDHRESIMSIDESDRPAVPPKTPESRILNF